jgi:hypothetical protein
MKFFKLAILTVVFIISCSSLEAVQVSTMSQEAIMANNKWRQGIKRYEIKIEEVAVKEFQSREYIEVKGQSNFPENTRLYIFLKKGNHPLDCQVLRLKDGIFSANFGPLDKKTLFGEYQIEASVMHFEQNTSKVKSIIGQKAEKVKDAVDGTVISRKDGEIEKISSFYTFFAGNEAEIKKTKEQAGKDIQDIIESLNVISSNIYKAYSNYLKAEDEETRQWEKRQEKWVSQLNDIEKELNTNYELNVIDNYHNIYKYTQLIISNLRQLLAVCTINLEIKEAPVNKFKSRNPEALIRVVKDDLSRLSRSLSSNLVQDIEIIP